jgi:Spy/CpxP family protein refolding chaperone
MFVVPVMAGALLSNGAVFAQKNPQAFERVRTALESLNLSAEQKEKMKPILSEQAEKVRAARADAKTDKRGSARKVREVLMETEARMKPVLTDEQWTKFQELQEKARADQKAKQKNKKNQ